MQNIAKVSISICACSLLATTPILAQSAFDEYTNRFSMTCIAEGGPIRFEVNGEIVSIAHGEDFLTRLQVDGEIVMQNGTDPQYIINLDILEYFIDFNARSAVATFLGSLRTDLYCV